jgi:hypothetical protein
MNEQTRDAVLEAASTMRAVASAYRSVGDTDSVMWVARVAWAVNREAFGESPEWAGLADGPEACA